MCKKTIIYGILFFSLITFILGCTQDSALSDVELSDPSLIFPEIKFIQEREGGDVSHKVVVWILDKNRDSVEILDGGVRVGDTKMSLKEDVITKAPYYQLNQEVDLGVDYTVSVVLSDGEEYDSNITIQDTDLDVLNVPATHKRTEDMVITWDSIDSGEMELIYTYFYSNEQSSGNGVKKINIPNSAVNQKSYVLEAAYFQNPVGIYEAKIKIGSEKSGIVCNDFRSGGFIKSLISYQKTCEIVD
jgi:hypothetical protein